MNLKKLNPWNWFKHEQQESQHPGQIPVAQRAQPLQETQPLASMLQLHQQMDRLFDDAFRSFGLPSVSDRFNSLFNDLGRPYRPSTDVSGDEKHYEVVLDLPGMNESELSIEVDGRLLTISGEQHQSREQNDRHYYCVERHSGAFRRTLSLPDDAAAEDIQAELKNGLLRISIPRIASVPSSSRKIEITTAG